MYQLGPPLLRWVQVPTRSPPLSLFFGPPTPCTRRHPDSPLGFWLLSSLAFGLPAFPGSTGSPKLLGHPFRTRHGLILRRSMFPRLVGFHRAAFRTAESLGPRDCYYGADYRGSHASLSTHRRRRYLRRRKTRFRPAGSALVELDSHQPGDYSEFHDIFVSFIPF